MLCVLSLSALSQLKMTSKKRFSVNEVLSQLFDHESDIEENVSETEDDVEEDPDYEASSSDENETLSDPPVVSQPPANTLPSKNGKLLWSVSPLEQQGRLSAANVIKMVPGPTRYAVSHVQDIKSAFELFITPSIERTYLRWQI